ncbi:MAG TPA: heterodisulfide reductase-related iron-sulfur binding cluster [Longimicrobiales bacterium]|nr:heterodisulfide reductase-related iron-sulfur binding cluster [Longimicrobiales bacterium]
MVPAAADALARSLEDQRERLLPCVHCGFCLAACPTYNRLGDEADSPRGRLHLMSAVVDGRLDAASDAFQTHIDRCLGCRACETVCPSGVAYGQLIELARDVAAKHRRPPLLTRLLLLVFSSVPIRRAFFFGGKLAQASGLAALTARLLPGRGVLGSARLGMAMVAATAPWKGLRRRGPASGGAGAVLPDPKPPRRGRVAILDGCVQEGLYGRVNAATVRVLEANGFEVVTVRGQDCCGALHAHSGDLEGARGLARLNVACFEAPGVDLVVVNAAGCGASMKEYTHLLAHDPAFAARAATVSAKVRDVHEILAEVGPRPGAPVPCRVAFDYPCHLLHAQRIRQAPLTVLAAVPGAEVTVIDGADECCGGAGIYGITHPELGGRIGGDKIAAVRRARCDVAATPNPGCMMQIGAGLILEGAPEGMIHPVELLDESYRRAGFYA